MAASALESLELYKGSAGVSGAAPVEKLDVAEVLRKTATPFFESLRAYRAKRVSALDHDVLAVDGAVSPEVAFSMRGRTVVVTGASRGIGEAIAVRCAGRGANVVILAQTTTNNPALPGTIQDAEAACVAAGGAALAIKTDITDEQQVQNAIASAVARFGGIDVLVNNASTHWPVTVAETDVRRYDVMMRVNLKGAFIVSRACAPHLARSPNPHILTVAPAPVADATWLKPHVAYSASKIAMGFLSLALDAEFGPFVMDQNLSAVVDGSTPVDASSFDGDVLSSPAIACNTLWPRYAVATAAIQFIGGERLAALSRTPACVADAAFRVVHAPALKVHGNCFIDERVLRGAGVSEFKPYNVTPDIDEPVSDFFVEVEKRSPAFSKKAGKKSILDQWTRHRPEAMRPIESANILFVVNGTWGSLVVRSFLAPTDVYVSKEELQETGKRVVICQSGTPRSESYWRKIIVGPRSKCISADLRDPSNLATAMEEAERFMYDIDAVVDLIEPPSFEASASIERTSAKVFDDLFDVPVRASFFLAQNAMRALVKSTDGPRRIVSLCQPPLASRTRFRKIGAAAELARTCRALHLVGCAAEFADLEPAVSMVGLWTDDRTVKSRCTYSDCAKAIRAALNASDRDLESATFWRIEDVLGLDHVPDASDEFCLVDYAPADEPIPDVAEEIAEWEMLDDFENLSCDAPGDDGGESPPAT